MDLDLGRLEGELDALRETWKVPGFAVAVVQGGDVVFSRGFGRRNIDSDLPVTTRTQFPIASVSKQFTSAVIASLVDEGILEWDRPLRHYIPWFRMYDPVVTERLTIRDALSHRSGLPRHDLVWVGREDQTREQLVRRLAHLQPNKDFREVYQYNNLLYTTAGLLVEELTGETWEQAVQRRILDPVGMTETTFSVKDVQAAKNHSRPYTEREDETVEVPFRPVHVSAPCGGINSTASDLARWMQCVLGGGLIGGTQVLSTSSLRECHSPAMVLPESDVYPEWSSQAYGLGWAIATYRGRKCVYHDGNVDGFSSWVTTLPREDVGVVVLTNQTATPLPKIVSYRVFDEVLGLAPLPWSDRIKDQTEAAKTGGKEASALDVAVPETTPSRPLDDYVGTYEHPGYGQFVVALIDGALVPQAAGLDLAMDHHHFDTFRLSLGEFPKARMKVQFHLDDAGEVSALTAPFEATTEPIRFTRVADERLRDPSMLEVFSGDYVMGPITLKVRRRGNAELTGSTGTGTALLLPHRGLTYKIEGQPHASVEFQMAEDGTHVVRVVLQPAGVFLPVEDATASAPQSKLAPGRPSSTSAD